MPVLGGYIGATASGIPTTLGRGGSDYTAALLGAALEAEAIEIWTDVDGMLTGDPRVVEQARLIEHIRFDEAAELAAFGAKVLHPSTIAPAVQRGIPVYIYNSWRPEGTRHAHHRRLRRCGRVTAIAGKGDITIVKVRSARMLLAHGILRAHLRGVRAPPHLGGRRRHLGGVGVDDGGRPAAPGGAGGGAARRSATW